MSKMATSSYRDFFSSPIARFLEHCEKELSPDTDEELDQLLSSLPLDVPQLQPTSAPPTALPTISRPGPSSTSTSSTLELASANAELQRLKDKNKNTEKSTNTRTKKFEKWIKQKGAGFQCVSQAAPNELDAVLQHFFAEVKKDDGSDYEPESLRTMLAALDRSFRSSGCKYSIAKDKEFTESRKVLNGKAIELREQGMGKRKNKADAVTDEEEALMWKSGILGDRTPSSLNHTVFYTLSQQFGTRGHQEHHQIKVEELKFVKNAMTGQTEYVEWVEGLTKTQQGGLAKKDRRVP